MWSNSTPATLPSTTVDHHGCIPARGRPGQRGQLDVQAQTGLHAGVEIQWEDNISASVVVPSAALAHLNPDYRQPSVKFTQNCDTAVFQRPDDAIHRGFDAQAEARYVRVGEFISNFEPLTASRREIPEHAIELDQYTEPVKELLVDRPQG